MNKIICVRILIGHENLYKYFDIRCLNSKALMSDIEILESSIILSLLNINDTNIYFVYHMHVSVSVVLLLSWLTSFISFFHMLNITTFLRLCFATLYTC